MKLLRNNVDLREAAVLVLANKIDLPSAMPMEKLSQLYGLNEIDTHKYLLQACCALTGEGLADGFAWLSEQIIVRAQAGKQNSGTQQQ